MIPSMTFTRGGGRRATRTNRFRSIGVGPTMDASTSTDPNNLQAFQDFKQYKLGKSITSHFQNLNSADQLVDPLTSVATGMMDGGVDIDNNDIRTRISKGESDLTNLIQMSKVQNNSGISNARNAAIAAARKPWEVTDASSDFNARRVAETAQDAHMDQMLRDYTTNQENTYRTRLTNQDFWGSLFGPFGRLGATISDTINNDSVYGNNDAITDAIKNSTFDPLAASGRHVRIHGTALPDDLGTEMNQLNPNSGQSEEIPNTQPEEAETSV